MKLIKSKVEGGFTLIELTITAMVLSMVVIAVTTLFISVEDTNRQARNWATAVQYENQLMENSRNSPYGSLAVGTTDFSASLPTRLAAPRNGTMTVTEVGPVGLKRLDIAITYTEKQKTRRVQTSTYIARRGIDR